MANKRFKLLDAAFRYIQSPTASDTVTQPAEGTILANYLLFKAGNSTYTTTPADKAGVVPIGISPFYAADAATTVIVNITGRSNTVTDLAGIRTAANHLAIPADPVAAPPSFRAARAVVKIATSSETKTASKITGIEYNKIGGASYTIPFGAKTGTLSYLDNKAAIVAAYVTFKGTATLSHSLTFDSEFVE